MRGSTRRDILVAGLGLMLAASPLAFFVRTAAAQDLASAKRDGYLGERIDGFLGVVRSDAPADVRALADQINGRRQTEYAAIATRQGAPVEAVALLAGERLIERAAAGEWVMGADGNWRQK
jgi:uncharacterized protein YdbL (DUF1318 family)